EWLQLDIGSARDNADCTCCRQRQFEYLDGRAGSSATSLCGRDAVQLRHRQRVDFPDLDAVAARLRRHGAVEVNDYVLCARIMDGESNIEITLFRDGRAIIKGTQEPDVARGVYAKYVGN
ncbi:MAG: thiazole biosynthesis adenylyltransferase ThiF, partial [Gammaproteobacteria bacterium]